MEKFSCWKTFKRFYSGTEPKGFKGSNVILTISKVQKVPYYEGSSFWDSKTVLKKFLECWYYQIWVIENLLKNIYSNN